MIQFIPPSIRLKLPGWKLRRWWRSFSRTVLEFLALIGAAALIAALACMLLFVR